MGVYDAASGIREGDYSRAGVGAADAIASGALLTPAAPAAAAYLGGRAAWEGGKYLGDRAYQNMDTETQDNVGGFIAAQLNRINPAWGESEYDQAERRMRDAEVAPRGFRREETTPVYPAATTVTQNSPEAVAAANLAAEREAEFAPRTYIDPQGKQYSEPGQAGPPAPGDQTIAAYLRQQGQDADTFGGAPNAGNLRTIPGAPGTQYAGRYGGQEVIATTGANGEPVFTGLRTPQQVDESLARDAAMAAERNRPRTTEERLTQRMEDIQNNRVTASSAELRQIQSELGAIQRARETATGRSTPMTPGELTQDTVDAISPMFQQYGEEAPKVMSQFMRDIAGTEIRDKFFSAPPAEQARMIDDWSTQMGINDAFQTEIGRAGSDLRLTEGLRGSPRLGEPRDARFTDWRWLNPNSSLDITDVFSVWDDPTQVAEGRIQGQNEPFLVNYDNVVGNDQAALELLRRQQRNQGR